MSTKSLSQRWAGLSRGDKIALLLAEAGIVAVCLWILPITELHADWQTGLVVYGLVFAALQFVVVFIVAVIAGRREGATITQPTNWKQTINNAWQIILGLVAIGLLYGAGGYVVEWMFPESDWATKWRYSLDNDLRNADYVIERHPHDCEFMSPPMGSKHCHYDKQVATLRVRRNQSRRDVSFDDGKTWSPAEPGVRPAVFVTWTKVQE